MTPTPDATDTPRVSAGDLLVRLAECPDVGSLWVHHRTRGSYRVLDCAVDAATLEPLVVYQCVRTGVKFARRLAEWRAPVGGDGGAAERFREVGREPG